jgi:hypothetical protein
LFQKVMTPRRSLTKIMSCERLSSRASAASRLVAAWFCSASSVVIAIAARLTSARRAGEAMEVKSCDSE